MKFKIKYASNIATVREETETEIKEFNRLDKFIKWIESLEYPVIIDYNKYRNRTTVPREIYIYDDYIE